MRAKRAGQDMEHRLYRLWRQAATPVFVYASRAVAAALKAACRAAADALNKEAARDRGLSGVDERMFVCYQKLMAAYNAVPAVPLALTLNGEAARIWDGVCAVIHSRVKLFEESGAGGAENPVLAEKKRILADRLQQFLISCEAAASRFQAERLPDCEAAAIGAAISGGDPGAYIAALTTELFAPQVRKLYEPTLAFAAAALNDMGERRTARYYDDLLTEEREILASLIHIQIRALEPLLDGDAARAALDGLRRAYQFLCAETDGFAAFHKSGATPPTVDAAGLDARLAAAISAAVTTEDFSRTRRLFDPAYAAFREAAAREAEHFSDAAAKKQAYRLTKLVYEQDALARELSAAFEAAAAPQIGAGEAEQKIIDGILETIHIKTDTLREERERLATETRRILDAFKNERAADRPFAPIADALAIAGRDASAARAALKQLEYADDAVCKQYEARLQKRLAAFLREGLLAEVSTFEEIMNYSVPLLRKSQNAAAAAFTARVDAAMAAITGILARYGVEIIRPEPHDPFNGKLHEVLTAEQAEGFHKGEVIKVMNNGYKRDGTVLLRANVIAAR